MTFSHLMEWRMKCHMTKMCKGLFKRNQIRPFQSTNIALNQINILITQYSHFIKIHLLVLISRHTAPHNNMHQHTQLTTLLKQDEQQSFNYPEPTPKEIHHSIELLQREMRGRDLLLIFQTLQEKVQQYQRDKSYWPFSDDCQTMMAKQQQKETLEEQYGFKMPVFEIREIMPIVRIKEKKEKTEERDWLNEGKRVQKEKKDGLSGQIWNRYEQQKEDDMVSMVSTSGRTMHAGENEQNLKKMGAWDLNCVNKEFRMIVNKIAPRFSNKEQELKYYQKRQAAKVFSDKKNESRKDMQQLDVVSLSSHYGQKAASRSTKLKGFQQKRRDKNIKNSFIVEAFRKYENFIMAHIDKRIRPITGSEMRVLYPVLLKAPQLFTADEYHTFRKFVKYSFDLGSVSLYERPIRTLFRTIHSQLKEKLYEYNNKLDSKSTMSESRRSWNVKYDSVSMTGMEEQEEQCESKVEIKLNRQDLDDQQLQF